MNLTDDKTLHVSKLKAPADDLFSATGLYSLTIFKKVLSLVLRIFLYLAAFECYTTSDWLDHTVYPIRRVTFNITQLDVTQLLIGKTIQFSQSEVVFNSNAQDFFENGW